jgi:hypothetical protein
MVVPISAILHVLRLIATIQPKMTTAFQLFKRLNSHSWQHPLYQALKEFRKIPKTLFILKYRHDLKFRQSIEKQLNKEENEERKAELIDAIRKSLKNFSQLPKSSLCSGWVLLLVFQGYFVACQMLFVYEEVYLFTSLNSAKILLRPDSIKIVTKPK